ncbi:MAG TPA: ArsA-related P-loop ATPase [Acidimicrobiia bacterium]
MLEKRLLVVSGKGGVGKSAVAAALGQLAARKGKRVLLMDMGNSGGLAAHLGTGPLEFEPREVRNGISAMRIVRSDALLEYLTIQLSLRGLNRFGALARAFDALATAAPAIREIVTMGKVLWEVREQHWDLVIADAPPTGQIGSFLRAPTSISELVPTGRIQRQAAWMTHTLKDPSTTHLILVNLAEELPTTETIQTLGWLEENELVPPPSVLTNRILDDLQTDPAGEGPILEAAVHHRSVYSEQQEWLENLTPDIKLPFLFGLLTPPEVSARLGEILEGAL